MNTEAAIMTTEVVAKRLVQLCREGKNVDAIEELYSDKIISLEPKGSQAERTEGKVAVLGKTQQWHSMVEQIVSAHISDPIVSGNHFSCAMDMEVIMKGSGKNTMNEVCVYEVKDGKIVFEQFFYTIHQ
jgi:hypothetical protein